MPSNATPPEAPTTAPTSGVRKTLHGLRWLFLWGPGAVLATLLASGLALAIWASTPGSLATTLGWAQDWMQKQDASIGRLSTEGVEGSLLGGGRIESLTFTQGLLNVKAEGAQLSWGSALWTQALLGQGVHIDAIAVEHLRIDDQRPPTPTEPMESLVLPLPISVALKIDRFEMSGNSALNLSNIEADYAYSPTAAEQEGPALESMPGVLNAHRLRLDALQLADGRYSGNLTLGAEAPMPLALALVGNITTQVPDGAGVALTVHAKAEGTLAGAQAAIDISAEAEGTPDSANAQPSNLTLNARVAPWASQPVLSAQATAKSLNLAALWANAPVSDLNGSLQAQPEGDTWRAQLQLDNARIGPSDQNGLPLQSLRASVTQQGDRWTIAELAAQLGGGSLQGQGSFNMSSQNGATAFTDWQGEIKANGIRPALLWSELAQGALDGQFNARATPNPTSDHTIALQASLKPSAKQPQGAALTGLRLSELRVQGQWQPTTSPTSTAGTLNLSEAHIAVADAQLDTKGRFDTARLSYEGETRLSLPGATLDAKGLLAHGQGQGKANLQLTDTARLLEWVRSLQSLPFVGPQIRDALAGQENLSVKGSANAVLQWEGGLGAMGYPAAPDAPSATATAPVKTQPKPAWPDLRVALNVPSLQLQTGEDAAPLKIEGLAIEANGPLSAMQVSASGSVVATPWRASLNTAGQLAANADPLQGGALNLSQLSLQLTPDTPAGETSSTESWQLKNAQPLAVNWKTTADKGLSVDAGDAELRFQPLSDQPSKLGEPLTLAWQKLLWQANALETEGQLQGLSWPWIEALATMGQATKNGTIAPQTVSGDLVLDGAWNVRIPAAADATPELSVSLQRRSGDLKWNSQTTAANGTTSNDAIAAGVKEARINLSIKDRQVEALLRWNSDRLGQVSADASTSLSANPASNADNLIDRLWPATTPIRGSAKAQLPQVGVWSMFAPPGWRMSGTLTADATLAGTRGAPEWRGAVQADELALRSVVDGFAFTNGQLRATLVGDRISVDRFTLQGPGGAEAGGSLEASGNAEWRLVEGSNLRQPFVDLKATAKGLRVSTRVDRRLTLSGDVTAQLEGAKLALRGKLQADSAEIVLPDELAPSLSKDVIVRSTRTTPTEEEGTQRVQPDVSITVDLGKSFEVRGQGIDTRLEGQITVRATPALPTPRAIGEVRTVSGTFKAYGQQLNIETGVLRFTGPYDDPALDILAVRKMPENTDQRVGVTITGNAQAPRVGLYADPDLPDSEKLAWLVLGKAASASGAQAFVLQQAARQLLARTGNASDGDFAQTLGLDDIGFASASTDSDGTTTEAALTLGKRLSERFYLSYEQGLAGTLSAVSIIYDLSKGLSLRARAGTENAIDVIFTHRYD